MQATTLTQIPEYNGQVLFRRHQFPLFHFDLLLLQSSSTLFPSDPWVFGRYCDIDTPFVSEPSTNSYSLHFDLLWHCILISSCPLGLKYGSLVMAIKLCSSLWRHQHIVLLKLVLNWCAIRLCLEWGTWNRMKLNSLKFWWDEEIILLTVMLLNSEETGEY